MREVLQTGDDSILAAYYGVCIATLVHSSINRHFVKYKSGPTVCRPSHVNKYFQHLNVIMSR